jgi:Na+-translocating ferredoxin:NAD+ oxidoreductase RnfD subunit
MKEPATSKVALFSAIVFGVLAVIVIVFARGLCRYYSGIFFAVMATVALVQALRSRRGTDR